METDNVMETEGGSEPYLRDPPRWQRQGDCPLRLPRRGVGVKRLARGRVTLLDPPREQRGIHAVREGLAGFEPGLVSVARVLRDDGVEGDESESWGKGGEGEGRERDVGETRGGEG